MKGNENSRNTRLYDFDDRRVLHLPLGQHVFNHRAEILQLQVYLAQIVSINKANSFTVFAFTLKTTQYFEQLHHFFILIQVGVYLFG